MVNTTTTVESSYHPKSNEKKLEGQVRALQLAKPQLTTVPFKYTVLKNPDHNEAILVVFGSAPTELAQQIVFHRKIGADHQIDDHDWIMSTAGDMKEFQLSAKCPAEAKVRKSLNAVKEKHGIAAGALNESAAGNICYPNGIVRKEALDVAREASARHAKVEGATHYGNFLLYANPETVKQEIAYQDVLISNVGYAAEKIKVLHEFLIFQTTLIDGRRQKVVPYLRGVPLSEVTKVIYDRIAGRDGPQKDVARTHTGYFPFELLSDYKPGSEATRIELIKKLDEHAEALKKCNIAKADFDKIKNAKVDHKPAKQAIDDTKEKLRKITEEILAIKSVANIPTVKIDKRFEVSLDPKLSLKTIFKEKSVPESSS